MKNKTLWIVFAALLAIFLLSKVFNKKTVRSFTTDIIQIDTAAVDKIIFHNADPSAQFELFKSGAQWKVKNSRLETEALSTSVKSLLSNLNSIKAERPVAKSQEKWAEYEVGEEKGKRIELLSGNKTIEDLVIGRFNFNQQTRAAKSYIRRSKDNNVYSIDGFISMTISQSMDAFRNKTLTDIPSNSLTSLQLQSETGTRSLTKQNYWLDQDGTVQDSTAMENLLNRLSKVNGTTFYDEPLNVNTPLKTLSLTDASGQSIVVSCFENNGEFIIQSTQNPDSQFSSDSTGIFKTLFLDDILVN